MWWSHSSAPGQQVSSSFPSNDLECWRSSDNRVNYPESCICSYSFFNSFFSVLLISLQENVRLGNDGKRQDLNAFSRMWNKYITLYRVFPRHTSRSDANGRASLTYSPVIAADVHFANACWRTLWAAQQQRKRSQKDEDWPQKSAAPWEASAHSAHVPGAKCQIWTTSVLRRRFSALSNFTETPP